MMMTPSQEISAHKQRVKNDWELIEVIGKGTYGEVFKGKRKMDDTIVAIKVTDINQNKTEEMKTELAVFEKFSNHENIVRFINAQFVVTMSGTEQLWIITEYCLYGAVCDLSKKLIHEGSHLDESFICLIVFDTLKGLKYLHDNRIVHRDVKGSNILLNSRGNIKITDFGVSKQLKDEMAKCFSSVGTPFWMAPEVIACEQQLDYCYDNRCDIWSLGITTIELGDGDPPLADEHPLRALFKIPRSPSPTVKRPDKWTKIFLDFINCCLIKDYEKRPFADQLLEHEFCTKIKAIANTLRGRLLMLLNFKFKKFDKSDEHKIGRKSENFEYSMESLKTSEVQNLAQLENLSEETILEHLHERYLRDRIYTNIGDILIAINPFKWLGIYNENEFDKQYQNIKNGNPPPHVYSVARAAHLAVLHKRKNQCCVISGESGAGKTVTSNYLVEELAALGKHGNPTLVKKILQVNPLMEAFGNAATNINDNSSRFGKFLELSFNDSGDLIEAQLSEFLLEKSRVVYQSRGERNYHILYYLIAGLDYHRKLGNFDLSSSDKHRYLNTDSQTLDQFACTKQMQEKFLTVQKCFDIIGFTQEEVQSLYCILAAVIHLGDVEIVIDDSLTHHGERGCIKSSDTLNTVASLLCIEAGDLADALTSTSSVTRGETILRYNTVEQSCDCRDATAKALYSRLFSWIVKRINILLKPNSVTSPRNSYKRIGILDIFGFENLSTNSFEQLCINIANEQLQFYFNQHVFEWEFEEYAIEGIPLDAITFQNNRPVLEMFLQRPMGILALLDEESRFPRATVFSLVEKFCDNMNKNFFQKPKDSTTNFVIYHYAGKITYDANGFLEKNRDTISSDVNHLLHTSEDRLVRIIFQGTTDHIDEVRRKGSVSSTDSFTFKADGTMIESKPSWAYLSTSKLHLTMSVHFRNSLRSLMAKMIQAEPHFIRCIRPNSKNSPDLFDETKVMIQLRYTGVLETAKIRRQGYSERIQFSDFVTRYKCLVYYLSDEPPHDANTCRNILKKVGMETYWKIGKTKVFLKYFQVARLTFLLEEHRKNAIRLQRCSKAWLYKVRFKKEKALLVKAAIVIQRNLRGWLARKRCDYMKRDNQEGLQMKIESNPTRVQSGHVEEKRANEEVGRGYLARKRFEKLTNEHEKEEGEMKLQMIEMQKADDGNSEEDEGETALQDTKLFFFLAQVQMSTSDYVSLLHRTSYPVLFSLRQAATEKARKEASNQKLGSRERVLAVLDGTDDILQSKYHWAREQFESKIFRARTASERDRTSYEKDRRFPLNDEHDYDMKSRSSSLKLNESRDVEKKTDKLFSNLNDDQQLRKDIENDEEFHVEIRKNFRRNDRSKEYPLRSVMEGNKTMHSDKSHSPQFQWFTSSSAEADQLSYLARETSIPTEEKVHHQLHAWRKSSKQTHLPLAPLHQPYSYLQGAHIQVNKGDKEKVHQSLQPHAPVRLQHSYAQLARGRRSERAEVLVKELENDRNINLRNGHHKGSYLKEKGLRDSLTRILPRTDVDIHSGNGTDISLAHEPVKDPRSSLAYQIESHLLAKKSKKNQRNDSFSRNPVIEAKAKRENRQDRNLTSIENSNRLSQLNGFSYGIQEDQKGMLQGLHLRKTGRLQMLVQD